MEEKKLIKLIDFHDRNIYWIGLYEKGRDGNWMWTDDTPYEYANWASGEPNNWEGTDEDCAMLNLWGHKKWFDAACDSTFRFIC